MRALSRATLQGRRVQVSGASADVWSPTDLTSVRAFYRADQGLTLVGSDVQQWDDLSGVGNHLSAPAAPARPAYSATGGANSQAAVTFAASEYLSKAVWSWGATASTVTFWTVMKKDTAAADTRYFDHTGGASRIIGVGYDTDVASMWGNGTETFGTTDTTGAFRLWIMVWNGTTQTIYQGITQEDSDAFAALSLTDGGGMMFAASAAAGSTNLGTLCEAGFMRSAITAAERTALGAYCSARYGAGVL